MCVDQKTGKVKLKFQEMFTSHGEMSATGFMGVISGLVTLLILVTLSVYFIVNPSEANNVLELMDRMIVVFSVSAGLLGVRKVTGMIGNKQFSAGEGAGPMQPMQNDYNPGRQPGRNQKPGQGGRYYGTGDSSDADGDNGIDP